MYTAFAAQLLSEQWLQMGWEAGGTVSPNRQTPRLHGQEGHVAPSLFSTLG